jgi:drug/metabolite transporter (DMT)-like permease
MVMGLPFVGTLVWSGGLEAAFSQPDGWKGVCYVSFLGAVGTAIASIVYFLQRTNTLFATSVTFLLPVMSILIGALDGEAIGWPDLVGTVVILSGLYLART